MAIQKLTKENFNQVISQGETLVDFWADWCGYCQILSPVIQKFAEKYEGRVKVGKVDVDENPDLAERYNVMNLPTVVLFRDGQEADRRMGAYPLAEFEKMLG